MFASSSSLFLASLVPSLISAQSWSWQGLCTYHDYEGDGARLGSAYDNSPGWCGIRYSALQLPRITAVHGLGESMCAQCLEVQNANGGPSVYILAVDQKGAEGLDIARTSFSNLFPGSNPLDPQTCRWRIVSSSNCGGICFGSQEECTPGVRNLLPAYLLPPVSRSSSSSYSSFQGNTSSSSSSTTTTVRSGSSPSPTSSTSTTSSTATSTPSASPSTPLIFSNNNNGTNSTSSNTTSVSTNSTNSTGNSWNNSLVTVNGLPIPRPSDQNRVTGSVPPLTGSIMGTVSASLRVVPSASLISLFSIGFVYYAFII